MICFTSTVTWAKTFQGHWELCWYVSSWVWRFPSHAVSIPKESCMKLFHYWCGQAYCATNYHSRLKFESMKVFSMKTDNIVKSCEISACRHSSFVFPKAVSVAHRNNMRGGIKVPKTCTSSTTSGDQKQQIRHRMCCHRLESRRDSWRPSGVQEDI